MKDKENTEQAANENVKISQNETKSEVSSEPAEEAPSLKDVIKTQAIEDEEP